MFIFPYLSSPAIFQDSKRHVRLRELTLAFAGSSNMAAVEETDEETFLSDVHLYTPFLRTKKDNIGEFKVLWQLEVRHYTLNSVTTLRNSILHGN